MNKIAEKLPEVATENNIVPISNSPMELAQSFLTNGGNIDNLEKMLALQEKFDAMQAKKAYTKAMAEFKSTPLLIGKDKTNKQFNSRYTSIGNLVNCALPRMGECGLSHKWEINQTDPKNIKVTCIVTHSAGHSESVEMSAPPDTSGGNSKNQIQQVKSTITYLRSATFEGIMGLASTDANMDDDGNKAGSIQYITEKQASEIIDMLNDTEADEEKFLKWLNVDAVDQIPVQFFNKALTALKAKAKK